MQYCFKTQVYAFGLKFAEEPDEIDNHPLLEVRPRLSESSSASASGSATPAQISDAAAQPPQYRLKRTADSFEMSSEMWSLLHSIYGGGPAIIVERRRYRSYFNFTFWLRVYDYICSLRLVLFYIY